MPGVWRPRAQICSEVFHAVPYVHHGVQAYAKGVDSLSNIRFCMLTHANTHKAMSSL